MANTSAPVSAYAQRAWQLICVYFCTFCVRLYRYFCVYARTYMYGDALRMCRHDNI